MFLTMMKAKLHRAVVTQADLEYEGSIAIDRDLLDQVGILPHEQVDVLNINSGARFTTYAIEAPRGSKTFGVNGAAARLVQKNDRIIVVAYAQVPAEQARNYAPSVALLNEHDAAFVHIDEPKFQTSIRQNQLPNISTFYYLRAHGRNAKKWWHHDHKDERYDYLYSAAEIAEFGETLKAVRQIVPKTYAYMNNHADAKSVANAIELKHFLDEPVEGDYNAEFIARYPAVKSIVGEVLKDPRERDLARCEQLVQACFASQDYIEGRRAFLEKRAPRFVGA